MDNQRGFTLVELICIIAVLGILILIATPKIMPTIEKWILDSTARQIAEDIRWTQHLAITHCINHNFELDLSKKLYRIRSGDTRKPTIKNVEINQSITEISSTLKREGNYYRLTFTPTGNPSQTGSIILTSKNGKTVTITIVVGTGRVVIKP